ncbi:uncharacterized protein LOC126562039 [Anopheles maculipalpis]|uniref:uncharacterized protein LOC126562039 n=1 Tax=Anopheles maculipalpis TaxID=1496333 RepID=UPI002158E1C6|nr:uncharacterized protein LOC126562039 [Anopheles maculipalpis]
MEHIKLTTSFSNSCFYDENKQIRFDPPVYEQRYSAIISLLELDHWKDSFKKIVEFGCAEMKFFRLLRSLPAVEKILEVDIDDKILQQCRNLVRPLLNDHLSPSVKPLTVEVWRGNIAEPHECLEGTDVVIGIEIIEHLHQPILDKVPDNVFGFIKPKVAFFSTPNADYNVLFDGLLENGFRHPDHKFEWTRRQFEEWAESICQRYPDYCAKYFGIGPAPVGSESVGCVSQLAVFVRRDFLATLPQPVESLESTAKEEITVPDESFGVDQRSVGDSAVAARPHAIYLEENGEIVLIQPPTDEAASESQASGEPAVGGGQLFEDDIVAEERLRDDDDYDGYGDDGDYEDNDDMIDMYIPEEVVREMRTRNDSGNFEEEELIEPEREYWLIANEVYPVAAPDNRTREQHIKDAAEYQLRRLRNFGEDFLSPEQDRYLIPLQTVHDCMNMQVAIDEVRQALSRVGYNVGADDIVVLPLEDEDDGSGDDSDEDRFYDYTDYDDRYPTWDDNEAAKASQGVVAMTLEDCDEIWD